MFSAIKTFMQRRKKGIIFFSVANGSIRTTVSVHTERIRQQISFYEARQFVQILQLSESGNSETGQVEEQNLDRLY